MKKAVRVLTYVVLVFVLSLYFSSVYRIENSAKGLKEKVSQSEVLFVGTSGFSKAISPMELYETEGIASFNLANQWSQIPLDYYTIREYVKPGKTKLVVLDAETFFDDELQTLDTAHYTADQMPLDLEKLRFVNEPVWQMNLNEKAEFIAPLLRWHDKWQESKITDYSTLHKPICDVWQCYGYSYDYKTLEEEDLKYSMGDNYEKNGSLEYILKIKEYCKENNIDLLLLLPPWQRFNDEQYETLEKVLAQNDIKYEDFRSENKKLLDNQIDFSNSGHLNTAGAVKYSHFLGEYFTDNYDLGDYRDSADYSQWRKDLESYSAEKNNNLEKHEQLVKDLSENGTLGKGKNETSTN